MSARFVFDRHTHCIEVDLDSVGQEGFTTLFALGIINPMGPTMNALVASGFGSVGERRALLHLTLNPFSQSCYEVGVVTFGERSPSLPDLSAFFSLPFGACPTLLMPSALYSDEFAQSFFVELLQSFDDGNQKWHKLRHFPGDPWKRVENEMAGLHDFIAKSPKRIATERQPQRLTITAAREFTQQQLNPKNLLEEFKAFMFAWEGSINFTGLGAIAMSKERFLETFGQLALTLRLPFVRNIIDNPEILPDSGRAEAEEHPLLRIARSKYCAGSIEGKLVLRFMNDRVIAEGIREENDSAKTRWLTTLVRDARCWAEELLERDPETVNTMFKESSQASIESARVLLQRELGPDPAEIDDASAADLLTEWADGLQSSENGTELWKLAVDVVDAALWIGWLFPRTKDYAGGSGQSKEDPVIILTDKTWKGIAAEYAWISKYFGQKGVDWTLLRQTLTHQGVKQLDIMQIELSNGTTENITFDITSFFGK
jgi:hypothetical protein